MRTRVRLLDAALDLLAERGEDGVILRDLTDAAGANVSAVSYHFGSLKTPPRRRRSFTSWTTRRLASSSATSRPRRSRSCRSTNSGSRCPQRSATRACGSSSPKVLRGSCRSSSTCTAAAGCSGTPRTAIAQAIAFFRQAFDGVSGGVAR